jgi:acyl-CoA synthetase (AMP-forming)/AMP-acid ligase II
MSSPAVTSEFVADPAQVASLTSSRPVGHGPVRAYDWIAQHTSQRPNKEAVRDLGSGRSFTYAELDRRVDAMAAHLASIGIGRGDRVGVLAHNGVEYFDIQFACARRGAICVLLNWRLTVSELEYILNDSSPMLLVHDISLTESAEELQRLCSIGELLAIDGGTPDSPYEKVLALFDGEDGGRAEATHDDIITIMYTSGTTGLPKGAMITHGMNFWNRPEATAEAFEGRWLKTGDAARIDDEGFFYIVDRWKDMYISGGENVYPAEIENVLYQLPQVAEAAIIGIPNDKWGEVGLAVLALKPGTTLNRATVVEHCVTRLAKFKIPNDIAIIEALPRNATGKVLKRELRTQFVHADAPKIS